MADREWRQYFDQLMEELRVTSDKDPHMLALVLELAEVRKGYGEKFTRFDLLQYLEDVRREINAIGDRPDEVLPPAEETARDTSPRGFVLRHLRLVRNTTRRRGDVMIRAELNAALNALRLRTHQVAQQAR